MARHKRTLFSSAFLSAFRRYIAARHISNGGFGDNYHAFGSTLGDFCIDAVSDPYLHGVCRESISFTCPYFMFALTVLHYVIIADQGFLRCEAECTCRYREHVLSVQCVDRDISRQAGFQFQVRVMGGDHYFVCDYGSRRAAGAGTACVSQADLGHYSFENIVRIGIYGKCGPLSFFHAAYIGFIYVRSAAMVNKVGVSNPEATVCPSSTSRLMTTPSIGEVMVA